MRQSNNRKSRDVTAFLYERLSRDDNLEGESYSIGNQKKLLTKVAKEKGYTNLVHFLDDGISGVTMDRPGFNDMMEQLAAGKAAAVFVKDLSRLGRNYIEVGRLTEEFFPEHDIRLVAVSDNIDTAEGENELAPIRNLFNEWYARDISKKRRISNKIKGNAGEPMGQPPYGYIKDPDNPKHWIVDEEAAQVVRRIYSMTLEGYGTEQIAASLEQDGILTPRAYWLKKGIKRPGKGKEQPPTKWNSSSVTKILSLQEYCGDILNFKTYSKSYKNKKRLENDRENWVIFKDVHEPIIERAIFEQVQQKRGKIRKRRTHEGERNMFSGLLVCADCGHNLHFHFNQGNPDIKYFNCSNYKGNRGSCTSTHYVRVDFLEQVVLGEIRRLTKFASQFEDEFVKAVIGHSQQAEATDRKLKEKELKALQARDEELDGLFERIYEDNVSGKLSDDRFARMSRRYEEEQKELAEKIKALRAEIDKQSSQSMTTDMFISLVRKYTRARKLTPRMLNELIEKIEVFNAEKIDGVWEQRLRIHYNCVGVIEIPELIPLPAPEVSVNTRKGVVVNYAPSTIAG
ncbi:MAG TPA: recombinase family protein [Candidatus Fournierella merdavium]|nr:recombinase family protein [Candidatus Fournierella merdavium]